MRIILIFFLMFGTLLANMTTQYDGSYSFLKMAEATMVYDNDGNNYSILVKIKASGPAKLFSHNRTETVESRGVVINGALVPKKYIRIKDNDKERRVKTYHFDHFDRSIKIEVDTDNRETGKSSHTERKNRFYTENDILSLFYNFRRYFDQNDGSTSRFVTAIGGRKSDGMVQVTVPFGNKLDEAKDLIEGASKYYTFTVMTKMMGSKNGEFFIGMKDDERVKKVVLKDVVFFGDVTGELVE